MQLMMFSIYDEKVKAYFQPFFSKTIADAIRIVTNMINSGSRDNLLVTNSADFTLFHVGLFNDHDCSFENLENVSLGNLIQYRSSTGSQPDLLNVVQ